MLKRNVLNIKKNFYSIDLLLFVILAVLPIFISFTRKLKISESLPYLKQVDELILLLMLPLVIKGIKVIINHKYGLLFILFFLFYLIISSLTALVHDINIQQILFQIVLDLKILLVLSLVVSLPNKLLFIKRFIMLGKFVLLISFFLVIIQFQMPDFYDSLFPNGGHTGVFKLVDGTALNRGAGIFWFVGDLAIFSSFFVCYFFFEFLLTNRKVELFWLLFSVLILISTLSRLEIVATFISLVYIYNLSQNILSKRIVVIIISVSLVIIVFYSIFPILDASFQRLELYDYAYSHSTRIVYYYSSFILASENFPFGSGMGTFGGQASVVFGSKVYEELAFGQYWWYRANVQMTDTFWPHILGEAGYLGFLMYLLSLISLYLWIMKKINIQRINNKSSYRHLYLSGITIFIVMIINSLTSANLNNFYTLFICLILCGFILNPKKMNGY